jgi:hypothetical protein
VTVEHLDLVGLLEWADRIVGASDPRYERLTDLIDRIRGTEA